jgi:crotonobetainyl-CoA:carnitine CoA-transferase CaiB-like acyl-CoA transferase
MISPAGIYPYKDRYLFILAVNHQREALVKFMDREGILEAPRHMDLSTRGANKKEVNAIIEQWLDGCDNTDHALKAL